MDISPELSQQLHAEISTLEYAVHQFNYSELRAIPLIINGEAYAKASDQAIDNLFAMFTKTFLNSKNNAIRNAFNQLEQWPASEMANIMKLANAMLLFKNKIQEAENNYFRDQEHGMLRASLRNDSLWVRYFHYIIEQYIASEKYGDNGLFVKNVQNLGIKMYHWIKTNTPNILSTYDTFKSDTEINHRKTNNKRPLNLESFVVNKLDTHWYNNDEINNLLTNVLDKHSDIELLTAMLGTDWVAGNTLREQLIVFNSQRANLIAQGQQVKDKVIIPVNLGTSEGQGIHWVLLYIKYHRDLSELPRIIYIDPLGKKIPAVVLNSLQDKSLFPDVNVDSQNVQLQEDGYNCGPWIIAAAQFVVEQEKEISAGTIDVSTILKHLQGLVIDKVRQTQQDLLHPTHISAQPSKASNERFVSQNNGRPTLRRGLNLLLDNDHAELSATNNNSSSAPSPKRFKTDNKLIFPEHNENLHLTSNRLTSYTQLSSLTLFTTTQSPTKKNSSHTELIATNISAGSALSPKRIEAKNKASPQKNNYLSFSTNGHPSSSVSQLPSIIVFTINQSPTKSELRILSPKKISP